MFDICHDVGENRHDNAVSRQLVEFCVAQMKLILELEELGVLESHQPEAFLGDKPPDPSVMNYAVAVYHRQAECRRTVGADARAVLPYRFTVRVDDRVHAVVFHEHAGFFSLVLADARILTGGDATRHIGHLGVCVHVDEIHSRFAAEAAACGGLRHGTSSGVVDPFSLSSVTCEFGNSRSDFSAERKYLSGTSGIKISRNEHSLSALGDISPAVNTLPFATIPQSRYFAEYCSEDFPFTDRTDWGNVLKEKVSRLFGFKNSGKLKEQQASFIFKMSSGTTSTELLVIPNSG